jgi:hypothetical protein
MVRQARRDGARAGAPDRDRRRGPQAAGRAVALRGRRSGGCRPEGLRSHTNPRTGTGPASRGRWPSRALAARRRLTEWPRPSEPLVLVQEEFWCGWRPPTGCEVMRPTGSQDEIGLVAWEPHSRFAARSQEARRTRPGRPRPATACSTLIPRTMMGDGAGALKPGPAGHRRSAAAAGLTAPAQSPPVPPSE